MKRRTLLILALALIIQPLISFATPPTKTTEGIPFSGLRLKTIKAIEPIQAAKFQLVSEVAKPKPPDPVITATAYTVPAPTYNGGCGSDPMMAYIYTVESGCRTDALGPMSLTLGRPCGLGQALPCGKMGCSLSDWSCQDSWFRGYAVAAYGSIYNAYIFRQGHNYW